jgi:hypothetical protein
MNPLRSCVPLTIAAIGLAGCGPVMSCLSGASLMGPRWLSLLVGTVELLVIALAIVVAVIPVGPGPGVTNRDKR